MLAYHSLIHISQDYALLVGTYYQELCESGNASAALANARMLSVAMSQWLICVDDRGHAVIAEYEQVVTCLRSQRDMFNLPYAMVEMGDVCMVMKLGRQARQLFSDALDEVLENLENNHSWMRARCCNRRMRLWDGGMYWRSPIQWTRSEYSILF